MALILRVSYAMMLIVRFCCFFAVLQFVVITCYYASLRRANKQQKRTLNIIQLRVVG